MSSPFSRCPNYHNNPFHPGPNPPFDSLTKSTLKYFGFDSDDEQSNLHKSTENGNFGPRQNPVVSPLPAFKFNLKVFNQEMKNVKLTSDNYPSMCYSTMTFNLL